MSSFDESVHEPLSEINVTPFVDILLVLLIIFMITAPIITKPIDVSLPEENITSNNRQDQQKEYTISIDNKGAYLIDRKKVNKESFLNLLKVWAKEDQKSTTIYIRADKRLAYGKVAELMAILNNAKFYNVSLVIKNK